MNMVRFCCAYNCTARDNKATREAGVHFYRIPQDKVKRMLWLKAINRKGFNLNSSTVICSQHFMGGESLLQRTYSSNSSSSNSSSDNAAIGHSYRDRHWGAEAKAPIFPVTP